MDSKPPPTTGPSSLSFDFASGPLERLDFASTSIGSMDPPKPFNLLQNAKDYAILGPFDSRVGAVLQSAADHYFVTTKTDYIPALPIRKTHTVFLREDMRYGDDDPTLWPQQYSMTYCHLAAIERKPLGQLGAKQEVAIMWWDATAEDFISDSTAGRLTRGLGRLSRERLAQLAKPINRLREQYAEYAKTVAPGKLHPFFPAFILQMRLGLERLEILPCTFDRMVAAVTNLQRMYLETRALLRYMNHYRPLMDNPVAADSPPPPDHCVGAFTTDPGIAQQFRAAGLPYWLLRPTYLFGDTIILKEVVPRQPADSLRLEGAPGCKHFETKANTDAKIRVLHEVCRTTPWYKDPFSDDADDSGAPGSEPPLATTSGSGSTSQPARMAPTASAPEGHSRAGGPDRQRGGTTTSKTISEQRGGRHEPYPAASPNAKKQGSGTGTRDKFVLVDLPEMPADIPSWAVALRAVDRTNAPRFRGPHTYNRYVFPEPALFATPQDPQRRQLFLHHFTLLKDALLYRLADEGARAKPLATQEWRDVLGGKVAKQTNRGRVVTKAQARTVGIDDLLGPALRACGLDTYEDFPAVEGSFEPITLHRAREIVWEIAETNFRFEFLSLDHRASGLDRQEDCCDCFVGRMVMGMPVEFAKKGLASLSPATRFPHFLRMARLMKDWRPRAPDNILSAQEPKKWDDAAMKELEGAVTKYYTQTFYEYFSRAAVVPMRLEHEFGT
ncbi:hypothetical protein FB451DRAFT_1403891 [Mycena latifolia]|nr:hypothetical protein FB451DRAFT_1403891 [Mycena latifolia]